METADQAMQNGYAQMQAGALEQALAEFSRAEVLYGEAGAGRHRARACTNKALALVQLQRFDEALEGFQAALKEFMACDEFIRAAEQYGNIGSVHRDTGRPDQALESYEEARGIYQTLGLRERVADQCTNIAYAWFMKKGYDEALRWYREAVTLYTLTGSEEKRKLTAENVARLETALEDPEE
jgi:tetratricopeptide (TPR) repeat protein